MSHSVKTTEPQSFKNSTPKVDFHDNKPPEDDVDFIEWAMGRDKLGIEVKDGQWRWVQKMYVMGEVLEQLEERGIAYETIKAKTSELRAQGILR
jgi:hypothetical protein